MPSFGALSVLPPVLAIVAAIASRRAIPGLFVGIWTEAIVFTGSHGLGQTFEWIVVSIATEFHVSLLVFIWHCFLQGRYSHSATYQMFIAQMPLQ